MRSADSVELADVPASPSASAKEAGLQREPHARTGGLVAAHLGEFRHTARPLRSVSLLLGKGLLKSLGSVNGCLGVGILKFRLLNHLTFEINSVTSQEDLVTDVTEESDHKTLKKISKQTLKTHTLNSQHTRTRSSERVISMSSTNYPKPASTLRVPALTQHREP